MVCDKQFLFEINLLDQLLICSFACNLTLYINIYYVYNI